MLPTFECRLLSIVCYACCFCVVEMLDEIFWGLIRHWYLKPSWYIEVIHWGTRNIASVYFRIFDSLLSVSCKIEKQKQASHILFYWCGNLKLTSSLVLISSELKLLSRRARNKFNTIKLPTTRVGIKIRKHSCFPVCKKYTVNMNK